MKLGLCSLLIVLASLCNAQMPPISTIGVVPDTVTTSTINIPFTVNSTLPWNTGGGVGFYYRVNGGSWGYAGASYVSPFVFTIPTDHAYYDFITTVADNNGNNEGYIFVPECTFFTCLNCTTNIVLPTPSQPDSLETTYRWTSPTTGSPVVAYNVELKEDQNDWVFYKSTPDTNITMNLKIGITYTVRVAGVDALDRQGVYSDPSEPYTPQSPEPVGPPSKPGKPYRVF